jgi:hypothetical protein
MGISIVKVKLIKRRLYKVVIDAGILRRRGRQDTRHKTQERRVAGFNTGGNQNTLHFAHLTLRLAMQIFLSLFTFISENKPCKELMLT